MAVVHNDWVRLLYLLNYRNYEKEWNESNGL